MRFSALPGGSANRPVAMKIIKLKIRAKVQLNMLEERRLNARCKKYMIEMSTVGKGCFEAAEKLEAAQADEQKASLAEKLQKLDKEMEDERVEMEMERMQLRTKKSSL